MKLNLLFIRAAIAALIACAFILQAGCRKPPEGSTANETAIKYVVVQPVPTGFIRSSFTKPGELRPVIQVTLSAQISGQIMQVMAKEGDVVSSGQVLAAIDDRELRAAYAQIGAQVVSAKAALEKMRRFSRPQEIAKLEASVQSALVAYENAEKNLMRANELFDSGVVPLSHVENARATMEIAKSAYTSAVETLSLAEEGARQEDLLSAEASVKAVEAELDRIGIQIDKSTIKAPVDGVIAKIHVDPSELVSPGMPVADLVNLTNMQAMIGLSEADLITVKPGDTVAVTLKLAPGQPIPGIVTAISPSIDKVTGAFMVEVTTPNPGGQILGGFYADFEFTRAAVKDAVIVPIDTLVNENDKWFVFIVNGGRAEKREVKPGLLTTEFAQILEGIEKGSLLVVTGQRLLSDGDLVEITKTEEPKLPTENKAIKELEEQAKDELGKIPAIPPPSADSKAKPGIPEKDESESPTENGNGDKSKNNGDSGE